MSEDLFKRPEPSLDAVTGLDLAEREAAAAEKAAKFTATMTSTPKPLTAKERQAQLDSEIARKQHLDLSVAAATGEFQEKHLAVTLQQLQQTVTFHELDLRAQVRRIFETGYRAGFASGVRYGQSNP